MIRYWNFTDIAAHTGVPSVALRQRQNRGTFPAPDATIGAQPGWLPETIKTWWAAKSGEEDRAVGMLTTNEAAALLDISPRTLASWRAGDSARGPEPVKINNLVRYRRADVDAWLEGGQGA